MTFKINIKPQVELSDEEIEAQAERDDELKAFERHELEPFLKLLELHTEVEPEYALEAFNASFFVGLWNGNIMMMHRRGKVMLENAQYAYELIESKIWDYEKLAENLRVTLEKARTLGKA